MRALNPWIVAIVLSAVAATLFAIIVLGLATLVDNEGWIVAAGLVAILVLAALVIANSPF